MAGKSDEKYRPWAENYKPPASGGQNNTGCAVGTAGIEFKITTAQVTAAFNALPDLNLGTLVAAI